MRRLFLVSLIFSAVAVFGGITLMWFTDGPDLEVIKRQVEEYGKLNNVEVEILNVPYYQNYKTKLTTMIRGGNPPDAARTTDVLYLMNYGIDLTPYIEKYTGMSVEEWINNVSVYKTAFKRVVEKFGKIVGIPYTSDAHAVFYNKDIFKKAGIEVPENRPWTIDEWYEAMKKIKKSKVAKYALVYDYSPYRFSNLLYVFGGGIWDPAGTKIIVDSPESIEALKFFVKLHDEGLIPKSVWLTGDSPYKYFQSGMAAMYVSGTWMLAKFKEELKFNWGVMMFPFKRVRAVMTGGKYIVPFTEEGVKLAFFLTNKEKLAEFAGELSLLPDRKDLMGKVEFKDPIIKEVYAIIMKDLADSTRGSMVADWYDPDTSTVVQENYAKIRSYIAAAVAHEMTPEEAMKKLAQFLREEYEKKKGE